MNSVGTHIARLLLEAALAVRAARSGCHLDDGVAVPEGARPDSFPKITHDEVKNPNGEGFSDGNGSDSSEAKPADGA